MGLLHYKCNKFTQKLYIYIIYTLDKSIPLITITNLFKLLFLQNEYPLQHIFGVEGAGLRFGLYSCRICPGPSIAG